MALQESTTLAGRPARKFTPANIQKIKDWVAEGISREEIAKSLGATVGSLQVTCSRLGISLRRQDLLSSKGPGRPRLVRNSLQSKRPVDSRPDAGRSSALSDYFRMQRHAADDRATPSYSLRHRTAQTRGGHPESEHGPTSGGSCDHGDQKGDDRSDSTRACPGACSAVAS